MSLCCFCVIIHITKLWIELIVPIQQSIKVFEEKKHARQWLSYWAIYMSLQLVERLFFFVPMIPLYWLIKMAFCWWLSNNDYFGASYLHEKYIDQHFQIAMEKIEPHLNAVMSKFQKKTQESPVHE